MFKIPVAKPKRVGPEFNTWFWHPFRAGARSAPDWFSKDLHEVDRDLEAIWNPIEERWGIFMRAPGFEHPTCWGWKLLFLADNLDPRIFHRLFEASGRKWGSAKKYFDAVEREIKREDEMKNKQFNQDRKDETDPWFDFAQIKVSMAGKSNGSKFADYLS
jgi:hypothetical protein